MFELVSISLAAVIGEYICPCTGSSCGIDCTPAGGAGGGAGWCCTDYMGIPGGQGITGGNP